MYLVYCLHIIREESDSDRRKPHEFPIEGPRSWGRTWRGALSWCGTLSWCGALCRILGSIGRENDIAHQPRIFVDQKVAMENKFSGKGLDVGSQRRAKTSIVALLDDKVSIGWDERCIAPNTLEGSTVVGIPWRRVVVDKQMKVGIVLKVSARSQDHEGVDVDMKRMKHDISISNYPDATGTTLGSNVEGCDIICEGEVS